MKPSFLSNWAYSFLLIVGLCLSFTSCSSDDEVMDSDNRVSLPFPKDEEGNAVITPIDTEKDPAAKNLFDYIDNILHKYSNDNNMDFSTSVSIEERNPCVIINSTEELKAAIHNPNVAVPDVDFSRYTVVFGRLLDTRGWYFDQSEMKITKKGNSATLKLVELFVDGTYTTDFGYMYFWNVYPKFDVKQIEYDVSHKISK